MKNDKIDLLIKVKDKTYTDVARHLGRYRQSVHKTKNTGKWTGDDLLKIAELTNTNLAFIDKDGSIIAMFTTSDIE